jgi:ribosomal protein L34E
MPIKKQLEDWSVCDRCRADLAEIVELPDEYIKFSKKANEKLFNLMIHMIDTIATEPVIIYNNKINHLIQKLRCKRSAIKINDKYHNLIRFVIKELEQIRDTYVSPADYHLKSIQQGRTEIMQKEINLQCLSCGKALGKEWTETLPKPSRPYHMHFCLECRTGIIRKLVQENVLSQNPR